MFPVGVILLGGVAGVLIQHFERLQNTFAVSKYIIYSCVAAFIQLVLIWSCHTAVDTTVRSNNTSIGCKATF